MLFRKFCNFIVILLWTNLTVLVQLFHLPVLGAVWLYGVLFALFVFINILPIRVNSPEQRLRVMAQGGALLAVCAYSFFFNIALQIVWGICFLPDGRLGLISYIVNILVCLLSAAVLFLNGLVRVCTTSVQLGIKWRVLLILCWWVPLFGPYLFYKTCKIVREELIFETEKAALNFVRQESAICCTKYPILLVHGVFFRDRKYFNYWGRIPRELRRNGATVYYGEQESAASVADSAAELAAKIRRIVAETGCQKLNIIAHSKGGLDSRYAISCLGVGDMVASLTTINTPHRGCAFADYLLQKAPPWLVNRIAKTYNSALRKTGDKNPDFCRAVGDLTVQACAVTNQKASDAPGVYYQSVGSKMSRFTGAPFPLCVSYLLVRHFSRENDGLVDVESARWGSSYRLLAGKGRKGISHGDMIDLFRKNIRGFDVREFYVGLVSGLKAKGF